MDDLDLEDLSVFLFCFVKVRRVLLDLKLAVEGTIIMSPDLRQAMDAMYDARVPQVWKQISWESSTLGFWFTEFLERNAQFQRWCYQVLISRIPNLK